MKDFWEIWDVSSGYTENNYSGAIVRSKNVNIHSKAGEVRLLLWSENHWSELTSYGAWVKTYSIGDTTDLWHWTYQDGSNSNGKAFKDATAVASADISGSWGNIRRAIRSWWYVLLINNSKVDKLDLATETTAYDSNLDFTNGGGNYYPAIEFMWDIIFGNGNLVYKIDASFASTTTKLTLPENVEVVYISSYLDQVKIYANWPYGIIQYIWDGDAEFASYINYVEWYDVIGGANIWSKDFLAVIGSSWSASTTYKNQWIMMFVWIQHTEWLLFRNEEWNCFCSLPDQYGDCVVSYRDSIFFWVTNADGDYAINRLYYDKTKGGYTVSELYTTTAWNVQSLFVFRDVLYWSESTATPWYQPKKIPLYNFVSGKSYNSSGYFTTSKKWYESLTANKHIKEVRVAYYLSNANQSISIYWVVDGTDYLIKTISDNTKKLVRIPQNEINASTFWSSQWNLFAEIQFKVELTRWATTDETPVFRQAIVFYDFDTKSWS